MAHYVDRYCLENAAEKQFFHNRLVTLVASVARFEGMTLGAAKVARILSTGSFAGPNECGHVSHAASNQAHVAFFPVAMVRRW